eukprot:1502924-Pleurochrysis_carterae.AAC.1
MAFISFRSVASIILGAKMKRFDSSGVSGGGRGNEPGTDVNGTEVGAAGAAEAGAAPVPDCDCDRVCGHYNLDCGNRGYAGAVRRR